MRIRIGVVATNRAETEQERKDTDEKTERYRGATIEAALVRIMKQRKLISHTELVNEVLTQMGSRFNPDLTMVKKRIESLMEREYMERAEGERQVYRYIVRFPLAPPPFLWYTQNSTKTIRPNPVPPFKTLLSAAPSHLFSFFFNMVVSSLPFNIHTYIVPPLFSFSVPSIFISGIYLAFMKKAGPGAL